MKRSKYTALYRKAKSNKGLIIKVFKTKLEEVEGKNVAYNV